MIRIYGMSQSGNCYKLQLLMSLLRKDYEWCEVDVLNGACQTEEFLAKNSAGKVPLLQLDDGSYLPESNAALFYLAQNTQYWPEDPLHQAKVLQWMFFEQYSHEPFIAVARFIKVFLTKTDPRHSELPKLYEKGYKALEVMEQHLSNRNWFVGDSPTIADIALFAYTHVAEDGGFKLSQYRNIQLWLERIKKLDHFMAMKK